MRVIAGKAKGHKLQTAEGLETRPTTDRIKETLFNMMAFDLPMAEFLDLFSGSGAIGIEALSRGAKRAVFVEQSAVCGKIIRENLLHTGLAENAELMETDVLAALAKLIEREAQFDMIFLDPPYKAGLLEPVLEKIVAGGLLKKDGYIIAEYGAKNPPAPVQGLTVVREKKYKTTEICFLRLEE